MADSKCRLCGFIFGGMGSDRGINELYQEEGFQTLRVLSDHCRPCGALHNVYEITIHDLPGDHPMDLGKRKRGRNET